MRHSSRQIGFTIIEMMITIVIASLLVAWAAPNMNNLVLGNRLTAETNALVAGLQFARSEAIKRGRAVNVSSTADPACTSNCDWKAGWQVWIDTDNNGAPAAGEVLRATNGMVGFNAASFTADVGSLTFLPNGALNQTAAREFKLNTTDMNAGENYRAVCLAYVGVVTTKRGTTAPTCP